MIILMALWSFQLHGADPPKITTLKQLEKTWRHEVGLRVPARRGKGDPSKYSVLRGLILHRASAEFKRITSKPLKYFEAEREGNGDKSFDFYLREALLWFHLKKNSASVRAIVENCCPRRCWGILTEQLLALWSLKNFELLFDAYWKTKDPELKKRLVWMLRMAAPKGTRGNPKSIEFIDARLYFDKKSKKEFDRRVANTDSFVREFQTWYNKNKSNLEREDTYSAIQPTVDVPLFYLKENAAGN